VQPIIAYIKPHTEIIVTMIARLLELGSCLRNSSNTLNLTLPLISKERRHPFADGFSPLQKRNKIMLEYGCLQNIEMHGRTCDALRNELGVLIVQNKEISEKVVVNCASFRKSS
jgi:hypothetical protein